MNAIPRTTIAEALRIARRSAMRRARAFPNARAMHIRDARDINHHLVRELRSNRLINELLS